MRVTLNNLDTPSNLITFTDIPNLLKVEDDAGGSNAVFNIIIESNFNSATIANNQWYISFMGETITNVLNPNNAINKNFYVATSNLSTSASMARALRNCPTVAAYFNIERLQYTGNKYGVRLTAKGIGQVWSNITNYFQTNIPAEYITSNGVDGTANSELVGSKINVDIYNDGNYVTTLEKNYYGSEAAFNLSPVLTTFAEYGNALPYTVKISSILDGVYYLIDELDTNYISIGYMVNQGEKYLSNDFINIAQNYTRGTNKDADNNTILYVYYPEIPISFYCGNNGGMTIIIDYLDSAFHTISSTTTTWRRSDSSKKLWDLELTLDDTLFLQSFYIDITLGSTKVRYNVIKPIKATEYYQRILWRNSYGGVSFFDFTGAKTETRELDIATYEKNIFDYYTNPMNELEKVYNNEVKYTVTLKSHLFENDGKYIFNDLLQSANVWTKINGQNYAIIIDSVSVDETDNNNIYEATVKYHYSQEPSLV